MSVILFLLLTLSSTPALAQSAIPLSPDASVQQNESSLEKPAGSGSIMPTIGAFVIVTGALVLVLWFLKRSQGGSVRQIPSSVIKTLGSSRIGTTLVFLVAVGNKLVLVSSSSNGLTPLTEIDNPAEADAIRKALAGENGGEK